MSADRRSSRKRERKTYQEEGSLDISDDFQEAGTLFRLPKRLQTCKSQENSKKGLLNRDTLEASLSCRKTPSIEVNSSVSHLGSETSVEVGNLQEIEKTLCDESEKLCPSCKLIVPCDVFPDHFKECLQKYKLTKEGCVKQLPVSGREGETGEQEKEQPVLPCPVCKKTFKARSQRVIHIKTCAQDYGLTSEQLLLASRLLEKQSEEWKELGLPTSLQLHTTAQKSRNSKCNRELKDPDIALALALSRSIAEEKLESRSSREEQLFALGLEDIVEEDRKVSPVLLPPPDSATCTGLANRLKKSGKDRRGRHKLKKSVLATRSVEERERLISEKVAVMLMSDDTSRGGWPHGENNKKPGKLTSITNKECQLWDIARGSAHEPLHNFYVSDLEPYIKPKEATIGGLLRRLSQVPGRLNTTALHAFDEESGSECELEEAAEIEEFCTQMALAGLIGSQEDLDITTEMNWEQATIGMGSQGFIIPSLGNGQQHALDFSACNISENTCTGEVVERNSDDLMEVVNAEKKCNKKSKKDISQSTEESLEPVISLQHPSTEFFELENGSSELGNISSDYPIKSDEKQESQTIQQCINISINQSDCNNEAIVSKTSCSITHAHRYVSDHEVTEKQIENSPLLSSEYDKESIHTSPTDKCCIYKEKTLTTSGIQSNSKDLVALSSENDSTSSSNTSVVLERKTVMCPVKEELPTPVHMCHLKRDCLMHTLVQNWSDLLESGLGSDVTITTSEGSSVQAHSLVFMARCPQLYQESEAHGKLIKWNKVPQQVVHKFLSYLYTGVCEIATPGDPSWIELYDIGIQYGCKDLVSYMKLLYKATNSPSNIPHECQEKDEEPLPLDREPDKLKKNSNKAHLDYLEKDSRTGNNSSYLNNDSVFSMAANTDNFFNAEELICTEHFDEKSHKQNEICYANKCSQDYLKSGHGKQGKIECVEGCKRAQSPDLFDECLYAEKCYIVSPAQMSPPLTFIPHPSPIKEVDHLESKELEEATDLLSKTSFPCKSVSSLGDREDIEILPNSHCTSVLSNIGQQDVLEGGLDTQTERSANTEPEAKSHLPPACDNYKLGDDNIGDYNVIDLTHSGPKCHSEGYVLGIPSDRNCPTETKLHQCRDNEFSLDRGNENPINSKSRHACDSYISDIWDDFDANSSMTITEELHSTLEEVTASTSKSSSINRPNLHLPVCAQSTSCNIATCESGDEDHHKDKLQPPNSQERNSLRCKTRCTVSPQAIGETSFADLFEGHSGDEILVSAATEIEESNGVSQSRNQPESTSAAAHTSYSHALTPHQSHSAQKETVTPMPDYSKMKSPELKKELKKYGICTLGRRKAVAVLQHVYEQTHPLVTDSEAESSFSLTPCRNSVMRVSGPDLQESRVRLYRKHRSSTEMQDSSKNNCIENGVGKSCRVTFQESERDQEEDEDSHLNSSLTSPNSSDGSDDGIFGDVASPDDDEEILSSTQQASLVRQVQEIITSRTDLYRQVLLYEPIFVENLHASLKAKRIRCSMQAVLDALDELCVIVRTQGNQKNRGRTKSRKRRATSPYKTPQGETH